ncbi:hypothetical protein JZ751_020590 [Albula glossodonta]|uniref:non-specific serine/threonine protein kinase n=1 Tax=Albula glossodonta TaxID=121402 RepID=A0A8T2PNN1_9TELE|nr:hypothetical protein JZ751_020590 [Albula glossodonta]
MSFRRPMTRSFSGNGRSGSLNDEDVPAPSSRPDSRNYLLNVRPENSYTSHRYSCYKPSRSTLCSVMSQLTEETQPSFETTLKSKAVSEDSNVKFTCEVSGYPVPELTWYKDDVEMDRYCGLPKYEIFRNGKVHTLHIYNCTLEDAAIYQASARNSKGIVSCSGVLEVGTMNEYKIHQRFFAKLKQKADAKRKELENWRRGKGKENKQAAIPEQLRTVSPERPQRKRRSPGEAGPRSPSASQDGETEPKTRAQEAEAEARLQEGSGENAAEQPAAIGEIPNGFPAETRVTPSSDSSQEATKENGNQELTYIYETVEITTTRRPAKETLATKRPKISNGVDSGEVSSDPAKAPESEREAGDEGGMSLAQYLAESLKSQANEDKQNSADEVMEVDIRVSHENEKVAEMQPPGEVKTESENHTNKKPEPPNGQGSLTAVFFSLRDMLFGSKNNNVTERVEDIPAHNHITTVEKEPPSPQVPPCPDLKADRRESAEDFKMPRGQTTKMEAQEQPVSGGASLLGTSPQHAAARELHGHDATMQECPISDSSTQGDTITKNEERTGSVVDMLREMENVATCPLHEPGGAREQAVEPNGVLEKPHTLLSEVAEDSMQTEGNGAPVGQDLVTPPCEPDAPAAGVFTSAGGQVTTDAGEMDTLHDHGQTAPGQPTHSAQPHSEGSGEISMETKANPQKSGPENIGGHDSSPDYKVSPTVNGDPVDISQDAVKEDKHVKMNVMESGEGTSQNTQVSSSAFVELDVEMKERESALSIAQKTEAGSLLEMQDKELKPTDNSQQKEAMMVVPEVQVVEPIITEDSDMVTPHLTCPKQEGIVPELPQNDQIINVPKIEISESPMIEILGSPTEDLPVHEQSGSQLVTIKATDIAVVESDQAVTGPHPVPVPTSMPENVQNEEMCTSPKKIEQVSLQHQEGIVSNQKLAEEKISKTETDTNSIPVINICLSENSEILFDPEPHKIKSPTSISPTVEAPPKVPTFVVPPISVTCVDNPPEIINLSKDEVKQVESVHEISKDSGSGKQCVSPIKAVKEEINPPSQNDEKIVDAKEAGNVLASDVLPGIPICNKTDTTNLSTNATDLLFKNAQPLISLTEQGKEKPTKEPQALVDQLQKDKPEDEKLGPVSPEAPMLSPTTLRRFSAKGVLGLEAPGLMAVPAIRVDNSPTDEKRKEGTGGDTPPSVPSCETSPRLKRRDSPTLIPSATPQELASGARRKIFVSKSKGEGSEGAEKDEVVKRRTLSQEQEVPYMSPSQSRKLAFLQPPTGQQTPPTERRSPLLSRKKATLEVPKRPEELIEETDTTKSDKPAEKETLNPFKAPQVIRKIRGEPFPDTLGHLKLWCQFFNVLSDSTIKWYRDEVEIAEVKRSAGDESQVALAIVQASSRDCGVYGCSIKNEYGTDTTDFLLSVDILSDFLLREDLEVGEEIEMTPLLFTKGLAEPGCWGDKFFGRIMTKEAHIGEGCAHKACRVKVIYGLEPVFESGSTCIIKVRNPIAYSTKDDSNLAERNLEITKQECKVQSTAREYCKVFAAEARVIESFGPALEMLPRYLMYRPANTIPYATVEVDLPGIYQKYCLMDATGRLIMRSASEVEQKCCTFQHWIHQWTNGNLLVTQLEGVGMRITNVGIVSKSKGYQGLTDSGNLKVFEQFATQHQCNYYCGLLGLKTLKPMDSQQQPAKIKGSRSPLLSRKAGPGSVSPQVQRKGVSSPQATRKATSSPKVSRKMPDSGQQQNRTQTPKTTEAPKSVGTR